jgi:hypothetical protein
VNGGESEMMTTFFNVIFVLDVRNDSWEIIISLLKNCKDHILVYSI